MNYKYRIAYLGQSKQKRYGEWEFRPDSFWAINTSWFNHVRKSLEISQTRSQATGASILQPGLDYYFSQRYKSLFYYNPNFVTKEVVEKCLSYLNGFYEHDARPLKNKEVKLNELDQT